MNRENYYLLLELPYNPPEHDKGRIDGAIAKKQTQWSKLRNHPTKGREAQMYLDMLPDIRALMSNKEMREEEAKEAKEIAAQEKKKKFKAIDEAIRLLSAKKSISEEELEKLAKKFSVTEAVLRKRIKVPIVKKKSRKKVELLDASVWKKITAGLAIVQKDSLYHFLALSPKSSLKTLLDKANEIASELKRDSRKTAVLTAGLELTGHCVNVFKTGDMKNRHDASMAHQNLDHLNEAIEVAGLDGIVEAEEYDSLLKKAMGLGLSYEEAEEHIYAYCSKRKWRVKSNTRPVDVGEMKQCGNCGIMNGQEAKNCVECGYPLNLSCPQCNHVNAASHASCSNCGFAIGDMLNAIPLLRDAKTSRAGGDIQKTQQLLLKVLHFWPSHPEAQAILQEIKNKENEIARLATQLEELVNKKQYYEARKALFRLKGQAPGHPQSSLERVINSKIAAAENWVKKAGAAVKGDDALDYFSKALLECSDCREANDGIAKYPPDPPGKLTASSSARSISLQWSYSPSRGPVQYVVVRKAQSPPLNAHDGDVLAETAQNLMDEINAIPGIIYYYAVFSRRGVVCSARGAIAGPIIRTAEVDDLNATPGDGVINLDWKTPQNAGEVMVRITPGGVPTGPNGGTALQGVHKDGVVATGLKNNQVYGFRVMAVFKDEKGKKVFSPGSTVQTRPVAPPKPVTDMNVTKKGNQLLIRWTPPGGDTVQIYHARSAFQVSSGEIISRELLSHGTAVPVQHEGRVQVPVSFQGVLHILPVTVVGDVAVAGKAVTTTSINEVSDLKGVINSGKLYLEWKWPPGAQKVVVAYNHKGYPTGPDDPAGVRKVFTQNEYLRNSAFIIRSVEEGDYYFSVFVAAGSGENVIYSSGCRCLVTNTGHSELYYEISLSKNFLGKVKSAQLKLFSKDGQFKIPKAVLVKKNQNLPLRRSDGIPILDILPVPINTRGRFYEIPAREIGKGMFVGLFFEDDAQHQRFRVMSPPRNKCELG